MSDQMPAMIPMPENRPSGESAPEMTRTLSPDEERDTLLNFMGNMYGEAKKMDSNIVGEATTLKRGAGEEIKRQIEQVYAQPRQSAPQPVQTAPHQPLQSNPAEAQPNKVTINQPVDTLVEIPVDNNQLTLNFNTNEKDELFLMVEKMLSRLDKLHIKVNDISESIKNNNITSLPIKKLAKKKSVEPKEEI
jgi:hypothetical protein|tara:strand:+ start:2737 stop:3309 length:573 start_codon:yes stop_codon:yes gene_type:complete